MSLIQSPHRNQILTSFDRPAIFKRKLNIGLLQFNLPGFVLSISCERVLQFKLGEHFDPISKFMIEKENPAVVIDLLFVSLIQVKLPIAAYRGLFPPPSLDSAITSAEIGLVNVFSENRSGG